MPRNRPEEILRQQLVDLMVTKLGYPRESLVLEKSLHHFPHLAPLKQQLPLRRTDILCFARNIHPTWELFPLLLVECKAETIDERAKRQLTAYNAYIQAYFIAAAAATETQTGWRTPSGEYEWMDGFPSYAQLLGALPRTSST